jgi:hypothetical protein
MQHTGNNMLKQVNTCPSKKPYWVCTKCNWPFLALQEANKHFCGQDKPPEPAFRSYTK